MDKVEMLKENELNEVVGGGNRLNNIDLYKIAGVEPGSLKLQLDLSIFGCEKPTPENNFYYNGKKVSNDEAAELVYYYFDNDCTKAKDTRQAALYVKTHQADFNSFINKMNVR